MAIKRSYIIAAVIAALLGAWILSGQIGNGGNGQAAVDTGNTQSGQAADGGERVAVRIRTVSAEPRQTRITIRGRTEAIRSVEVRSETTGTVVDVPIAEGSEVKEGDVLCRVSLNARDARMAEAEALMRQRYLEFEAARKLAEQGHRSETQAAAARASYDAAVALVKQAEVELAHTRIAAPFDGVLEQRMVEVGDYLRVGDSCARVVDLNPFLIVGQVSETDINRIGLGALGTARLITGEEVTGKVRYAAKTADAATRTFRVELEVPNDELTLRSGVTAQISIPATEVMAHKLPPSILTLGDDGSIGVRAVDENNVVHFQPVAILEDTPQGIWVGGLPEHVRVITVGQEYVSEGQRVRVIDETALGSAL